MKLWLTMGVGAALGAGASVLLRALRPNAQREPTQDDGVLEDRGESVLDISERVQGRALIESLGRRGGMTPEQVQFLVFVARKESRFWPNVGRGDPDLRPEGLRRFDVDLREAAAAQKAYARNAELFADCGHDPSAYGFGSGGLFAFLPVYPLVHLRNTPLRCAHPYAVFDPAFSMAGAYSFARGLSRHPFFDGTVLELRAGWGALRSMQDPDFYAGRLPLWKKQLRELGIAESWLFAKAPAWPKRDLMDLYRSMGGRETSAFDPPFPSPPLVS